MKAGQEALEDLEIPKSRIKVVLFATRPRRREGAAACDAAPGQAQCEVKVIQDGRSALPEHGSQPAGCLCRALSQG